MQNAISAYLYRRQQQQMNAVDACADAAEFYGVDLDVFARHLIGSGVATARDADRLALLAADVRAARAAMV